MSKKFEKISAEDRKLIEESFLETIISECRKEMIWEDGYRYEVEIKEILFQTGMTDEELRKSIELAIDILEELKEINNNGIDRATLDEIEEKEKNPDEYIRVINIYHEFCTDRLKFIMAAIDAVRRVGGAYAMLIANPFLISAIYSVFDVIVDKFDDEPLYDQCGYFLLRAIMKMHSEEIKRDK